MLINWYVGGVLFIMVMVSRNQMFKMLEGANSADMPRRKRSKYKNVPTRIDGHYFPSKKEARRYQDLKLLLQAGKITELKLQPKFPFPMGFSYIADFSYKESGKLIIEDVKGVATVPFSLKKKCFHYFYSDFELRIIK